LHKLRYSKTLKADPAGAFLGLVVGLFFGYLALASFGACSVDLVDLTVFVWYVLVVMTTLYLVMSPSSQPTSQLFKYFASVTGFLSLAFRPLKCHYRYQHTSNLVSGLRT
jgi:hypothetical protein